MNRFIPILFILFIFSCGHLNNAQKQFDENNFNSTISLCRAAVEKDSTDFEAFVLLGKAYKKIEKTDSAVFAFKKANVLKPQEKYVIDNIINLLSQLGDQLQKNKQYFEAQKQYQEALAYDSLNYKIIEKTGDALFNRGKHDLAVIKYNRALELSPDSTNLMKKLDNIVKRQELAENEIIAGQKALDKKQFKKAIDIFTKALEEKPDHKQAKYLLHIANGRNFYKSGKRNKTLWDAIVEFGYAASLFPERAEPHYYMGLTYNKKDKNEYTNAIEEMELAVEKEPDSQFGKLAKKELDEIKKRKIKMEKFYSN